MTKKHIAIEILPRILWLAEFTTLYFAHYLAYQQPVTTDNIVVLLMGVVVTIFGIYYLISSFYFLAKPMFTKKLMTDGPYEYVRHPIYVYMHVVLIGIGIIFFSELWFYILLMFAPLWYIDCKLEESQMTDLCGKKYLYYKKKVGMFFPKKLKENRLKKIVLNSDQISQIKKTLRFSNVEEDFIKRALSLTKLKFIPVKNSKAPSYLVAHNEWCYTKDDSDEEKILLRRSIELASLEESPRYLLSRIYDDADNCEDEESKMLVVREIAKIILHNK